MATPKKKPEKKKEGRPTDYNQKIAFEICEAIATSTDGIRKITGKYAHFPCVDTIWKWRFRHAEFAEQYANAKRFQAELLAEEITEISDDGTNDFYEDEDGNERVDKDNIARSRLRVDTRKWIACKLLPKIYGDAKEADNVLNKASEILDEVKGIAQKCMKPI